MNLKRTLIVLAIVLVVAGALVYLGNLSKPAEAPASEKAAATAGPPRPIGPVVEIKAPLGLPPVPIPAYNPPTAATIALGRKLYYDPRLSVDNTVSCATCHHPDHGFADDTALSFGVKNQAGTRNSPTVLNAAYYTLQFWDGRAGTLEKQAEGPVENPLEMAHTLAGVEKKLAADPEYVRLFAEAYGPGPITFAKVEGAIASFERTVIAGNSPFDRYYYGGDKTALSPAAQRGLKVFLAKDKGNCATCHTVGEKYALFTDNKFHNIGIGADTRGNLADLGRYTVTKVEADKGAFKTPSLRNIALTAPYMHDGSLKTLKDVVDYYVTGGNSNPYLDKEMKPLSHLSFQERRDLVAFLESLTGELPAGVGDPARETAKPAQKGL